MPEPRTEAGKRLLKSLSYSRGEQESDTVISYVLFGILAIEAEARADVDGLVALHDVVMTIEAMTWGRVFPAEPTPSTRDLVVFTAALGAAKRRAALLTGDKAEAPEPDSMKRRPSPYGGFR